MPGFLKLGQRSTPYADEAISAAKRWWLATDNTRPREDVAAYLDDFGFRRELRHRFELLLRSLVLFSREVGDTRGALSR